MQAVFSRVTDPPSVSLPSFPRFGVRKTYTKEKADSLFLIIRNWWTCIYIPNLIFHNQRECVTKHPQQRKLWDAASTFLRHIITGFFDKEPNPLPASSLCRKRKTNKAFYASHRKLFFFFEMEIGGLRRVSTCWQQRRKKFHFSITFILSGRDLSNEAQCLCVVCSHPLFIWGDAVSMVVPLPTLQS